MPRRETSSGLRPAASRPSIAQPVIAAPEGSPAEAPKPPSEFCTDSSQLAALSAPAARAGLGTIAGTASSATSTAVATAGVRHSKRSRKRTSIRTIAGPASSAKATLPIAWAASNGIARASSDEEVLKREISAVGGHQREVQQHTVGDPGEAANRGEGEPAGVAGAERQRRPHHPAQSPARHLPRRPGALTEPEVGDEAGEGADRKARRRAQRVAGEDDDVGRRLDVGEGGEGDPPGDRQCGQRRDQRHHLRRRPRALVPSEPAKQDRADDEKRGQLPGHQPRPSGGEFVFSSPPATPKGELIGCLEGVDALLGSYHPRKVQDPRHLGGEVPAAGEDLGSGAVGDHARRRRARRRARRRRRRTRRRGWRRGGRRRGPPSRRSASTRSPLRARSIPRVGSSRATRPGSSLAFHATRQGDRQGQALSLAAGEVAGVGVHRSAPCRRPAALPPPRPPEARRRPARGRGNRWGSGSIERSHSAFPPDLEPAPISPPSGSQQRALAGAVAAHQRYAFAALNLQIDSAQNIAASHRRWSAPPTGP